MAVTIRHIEAIAYITIAAGGSNTKKINLVFHYRRTAVGPTFNEVNVESAFQTNVMLPILATLQSDGVQTKNTIRGMDDATLAPVEVTRAIAGSIGTARAPDFVTVVTRLKTLLKGKSGRGRKFLGPIAQADIDGDVIKAASLARFVTAATAAGTGFVDSDGNNWVPEIISRFQNKVQVSFTKVNPTTIVANDVVSTAVNHRISKKKNRQAQPV